MQDSKKSVLEAHQGCEKFLEVVKEYFCRAGMKENVYSCSKNSLSRQQIKS